MTNYKHDNTDAQREAIAYEILALFDEYKRGDERALIHLRGMIDRYGSLFGGGDILRRLQADYDFYQRGN